MSSSLVPVSLWMASSSAYFASRGGASAVAVAASREKSERKVRSRYGFVSRHRTPSRRRVVFHDQSSTSADRPRIRCPPGWWTLTTRILRTRREPGSGRGRLGPGSRDLLHFPFRARLYGVGEPPLEEAVLVDLVIDGALLEQLVMG